MTLVDSHAHLDDARFRDDLDAVLTRARQAGVTAILTVGADLASSERAIALAESHRGFIRATVGIHPHDASALDASARSRLEDLARRPDVAAIGETGLDYYYDHSPRDRQRAAFEYHLDLAARAGLPVVVHCRDAFEECFAILERCRGVVCRGVAHCFSGKTAEAREFLRLGLAISFSGSLTFRTADALREAARETPWDRTLVETDCPYLAPQPWRGRRNEPAFVARVVETLAELRGEPAEATGRITSESARCVLGL